MSWTNSRGEACDSPRAEVKDEPTKERFRARMMRQLWREGWSFREIADFFTGQWYHPQVSRLIRCVEEQTEKEKSVA